MFVMEIKGAEHQNICRTMPEKEYKGAEHRNICW